MNARLTAKPLGQVIVAIQALDLGSVKSRLMNAEIGEGWSPEYADSIERAYKTYLTMLVKYPDHAEEMMLSEDVDEFWHTHILQTMKYANDCQAVFGNFLHHDPHVGAITSADLEKRERLAAKTRDLYQCEFGNAQSASAAWTGGIIKSPASFRIEARNTDFSVSGISPDNSAYSAPHIDSSKAAYSVPHISAAKAAYSAPHFSAAKAAYSAPHITAAKAAYSAPHISAGSAVLTPNLALQMQLQ